MRLLEEIKILKRRIVEGEQFPLRKGKTGNFIFIHINKTAGTSVAKCIGLPRKRHLTVKQLIQIVGKRRFEQAYKFTIVRNPWSKVVSHYQYRVRTNQTGLGVDPIPFKEWVFKTYGDPKDKLYYDTPQMFLPQLEWLKNEANEIAVDTIVKFEELPQAFDQVLDRIGLSASLPLLNRTSSIDYREQYDVECKELIADCFKEDINYFGYEF